VYASTDKYVDEYAKHNNKTYNEAFHEVMKDAVSAMVETVELARSMKQDILWDQTSVSVASRKKKFNMLPEYRHIAVVFAIPEPEELARRLASRPSKIIPKYVMDSMIQSFEYPTVDEGFAEIWTAV
jgi:predicted kinase